MQILQLSDIHGAEFLIDEIGSDLEQADIIALAGDITHFGGREAVGAIVEKISHYNTNIMAVAGNCDYPEVDDYLEEKGLSLHRKVIGFGEFDWAGISGSLPCPGSTPNEFSEEEFARWLETLQKDLRQAPVILLIHQPPLETKNDALPDGTHVGSQALRAFIEKTSPLLCMTAHIHEGIGIDNIKNCKIVNPGPFRTGKYALIDISGENSVKIQLKQITA